MTAWIFGLPFRPSLALTSRGITTNVPVPVGSGCKTALNLTTVGILGGDRPTAGVRPRIRRRAVGDERRAEFETEQRVRCSALRRSLGVHGDGLQSVVTPLPDVD